MDGFSWALLWASYDTTHGRAYDRTGDMSPDLRPDGSPVMSWARSWVLSYDEDSSLPARSGGWCSTSQGLARPTGDRSTTHNIILIIMCRDPTNVESPSR